ncbi:MAG: HlyD family efflux transporter periplasmic adaptor subunit [Planctomycetota bacterium]
MRSLQRIQHARPREEAPAQAEATVHRLDRRAVWRRERRIWLRRAALLGKLLVLAGVVIAVLVALTGSRIVADGVVRAGVTHVTAPRKMRVADWLVDVGQELVPGDPIVRLTPVERDTQRLVLRARVEAARARLGWFDAGGEQELLGIDQRIDRVVEAERNEALALAQVAALQSTLAVRTEAVALASSELEELRVDNAGRIAEVEARRKSAVADVERAEVESEFTILNAKRSTQLRDDGILSQAAVDEAVTGRDASLAIVDSLRAALLQIDVEGSNLKRVAAASEERAARALDVAVAEKEEALAAVAAAEARAAAFAQEAAHHRSLAPEDPLEPGPLREARRAQLVADLMVAGAALSSHDEEVGEILIEAQTDGVVDEVLEAQGVVVEAGTVLLRHRDTRDAQIVAYVSPATAATLEVGATCEVRCVPEQTSAEAMITAVGGVWIEAQNVPARRSDERRVAVTVELAPEAPEFRANARVKAVFRSDPWTAARRRFLGWLGL